MNTFSLVGLSLVLLMPSGSFVREAAAQEIQAHRDLDQPIQFPMADAKGRAWMMRGHICRPEGVSNPRLVVINHGSPPRSSDRPGPGLRRSVTPVSLPVR